MAASTSKSESQTFLDKKLINLDEKTCPNVDKFPVNFSGVPDIGEKIFGFLDFKDLNNCHNVCKGWQNFLQERRTLWVQLLEKEKIKLESLENYDSDDLSDCSDDSFDSVDLLDSHINEHLPYDMPFARARNSMDMSEERRGYVAFKNLKMLFLKIEQRYSFKFDCNVLN